MQYWNVFEIKAFGEIINTDNADRKSQEVAIRRLRNIANIQLSENLETNPKTDSTEKVDEKGTENKTPKKDE